jgi:hypothetical protein
MNPLRESWSPWATVAWTVMSLTVFGASSMAMFAVNTGVRTVGDVPHLVAMAEWSLLWGGLSLVGVLIAGRIAFGRALRISAAGLLLAGTGIGLSAVVHVVLQQWAVARFGYYDPEFVWWTASLFAVLVGLATATFGVFVAPRGAHGWPLSFVLLGAALVVWIVLSNVPGLDDGIEPESWPLAIWLGISGLYAVLVTIASVIRSRHPAATLER